MTGLIKNITRFFQKPKLIISPRERLLNKILEAVIERRKHNEHCILLVTPIGVTSQPSATQPASVALIGHDKISDFQETLLYIEEQLIKDGHYCIVKLAEDKSYANMFIYIDESILV
jgi:hypothetical protein